ncbi:MAG TPA: ACP phosphodiesterase [bacterium]|nr:ACP phosphodiesterase [bacterium]
MNHLAHALVAVRVNGSIVGNLMGDFVKGRPPARLPADVRRGVILHRRVDAFTDEHPVVIRSLARFRPRFRRWGGVLTDIFYDHVLAVHWDELGEGSLRGFADRVYAELEDARHAVPLPERMQRFLDYMRATDLLVAYAEAEGVDRALQGLSRRVRRENPLADGVEELERDVSGFETDLRELLPDVLREAREHSAGESRRKA